MEGKFQNTRGVAGFNRVYIIFDAKKVIQFFIWGVEDKHFKSCSESSPFKQASMQ